MIIGQCLTFQDDEQNIVSCEDFCFEGGVTYLPYQQKAIFLLLSLADTPFLTGFLTIDRVQITPTKVVNGTVRTIKLDLANIGAMFLVFCPPSSDKNGDIKFQKLALELKALKFPADSNESKNDKMRILMDILSMNQISYVLVDLNNPLTQANRLLWETTFLNYHGCAFFLSQKPSKVTVVSSPKKRADNPPLYLSYRVPLGLTSFLTIALACYSRSLQIQTFSGWGMVLAIASLSSIANILIGISLSKKTIKEHSTHNSFVSFEFRNMVCNLVGLIAALLTSWLLSISEVGFEQNVFSGVGLASVTLFGTVLLFSQPVISSFEYTRQKNFRKK